MPPTASAYNLTFLEAPPDPDPTQRASTRPVMSWATTKSRAFEPSYTRPEGYQAALWRDGLRTDLQPLPSATGYVSSYAWDISNTGQILGSSNFTPRDTGYGSTIVSHPVLWNNGTTPTDLAPLAEGSFDDPVRIAPTGINDSGQISAITDIIAATRYRATVITGVNQMNVLGPDDISSMAYDISNTGMLAGEYDNHPALWVGDKMTVLPDLGYGAALAINEAGHMVGQTRSENDYMQHAAMWVDGQLTPLAARSNRHSRALGINNLDQAVGVYEGDDLFFHAVLWDKGQAIDLTDALGADSAWQLVEASAINDAGQIVGWALPSSGEGVARAFLLSPVPEAATWSYMLLGLAGLYGVFRRQSPH
ncbi:MAG: hypothetical protein QM742_14885 [Aquabacterium sp.]